MIEQETHSSRGGRDGKEELEGAGADIAEEAGRENSAQIKRETRKGVGVSAWYNRARGKERFTGLDEIGRARGGRRRRHVNHNTDKTGDLCIDRDGEEEVGGRGET